MSGDVVVSGVVAGVVVTAVVVGSGVVEEADPVLAGGDTAVLDGGVLSGPEGCVLATGPEEGVPDEVDDDGAGAEEEPDPVRPGAGVVLREGVGEVDEAASGDGTTAVGRMNDGAAPVPAAWRFAFVADVTALEEPEVDWDGVLSRLWSATAAAAWSPSMWPTWMSIPKACASWAKGGRRVSSPSANPRSMPCNVTGRNPACIGDRCS